MTTTKKKPQQRKAARPLTEAELDPERTPFLSPRRLAEANFGDHETLLDAVKSGTIPSIRYQRTYRIPTRWVRSALGLDAEPAA
jgi:hypothetical protein